MNKWQIICPLVLILLVALWGAGQYVGMQKKGIRRGIETHLGIALSELENHKEGDRFPSTQTAHDVLQDESVAKRVNVTSLLSTDSIYYNSTRPKLGSDALVICAPIGDALYAMQADRKMRVVTKDELERSHLIPLASVAAAQPPNTQ